MNQTKLRRLALIALQAAGIEVVLVIVSRSPGRHWVDALLVGPYRLGSVVSGNIHQPNEFVVWFSLYLLVLATLLGLSALRRYFASRREAT